MQKLKKQLNHYLLTASILFSMTTVNLTAEAQVSSSKQAGRINNIVIVHGAFADGSGWRAIYDILVEKGYHVSIVQNPLTALADDVAAANEVIGKQDGPVILVGHSYGGAVITEAGTHPKVVGLVYVAAFQPKAGETLVDLIKLHPAASENGIMAPDENGVVFYSKEKFHAGFAGGLSEKESNFLYDSQGPISIGGFTTPLKAAAWTTKPSWGIVATEDKSINPEIERFGYKRSGAKVTEIKASHVVFMTKPKEVAAVIIEASTSPDTNR